MGTSGRGSGHSLWAAPHTLLSLLFLRVWRGLSRTPKQLQMVETPGENRERSWDWSNADTPCWCPCCVSRVPIDSYPLVLKLMKTQSLIWFFWIICLWRDFLSLILGICSFSRFFPSFVAISFLLPLRVFLLHKVFAMQHIWPLNWTLSVSRCPMGISDSLRTHELWYLLHKLAILCVPSGEGQHPQIPVFIP